jgi:methyl-accepting chemotaxis protein
MFNFTVRGKVTLLVISSILSLLILSIVSLWGINSVGKEGREIRENYLASIVNLSNATEQLYSLVIEGKNHITSPNEKIMLELESDMRQSEANARKYLNAFEETLDPGEETELYNQFTSAFTKYMEIHERVRVLSASNDDVVAAEISGTEGAQAFAEMKQLLEKMLQNNVTGADLASAEADANLSTTLWLTIIISVTAIIIIVLTSALGFLPVLKRIREIEYNMNEISEGEGDLRSRLKDNSKDEIGQLSASFNRFVSKIQELVAEVSSSTDQLATSASQLKSTSSSMANVSHEQQEDVVQATSAIEEINTTVQQISDNANTASTAAIEARDETSRGQQVVDQTINSINQLASDVTNVSGIIEKLEQDGDNIGKILDVIRSIAEQTNLLALNAAIEAARAGEQGRGFAVVADEVRTLAGRTQASTQEIQQMIEQLQHGTESASSAMSKSQVQTQEVVTLAKDAGQALDKITTSVSAITDMNYQIAAASEEQAAVSVEIKRNMDNVNSASAQMTSEMSQSNIAAEKLASMANNLQSLVRRFKF